MNKIRLRDHLAMAIRHGVLAELSGQNKLLDADTHHRKMNEHLEHAVNAVLALDSPDLKNPKPFVEHEPSGEDKWIEGHQNWRGKGTT